MSEKQQELQEQQDDGEMGMAMLAGGLVMFSLLGLHLFLLWWKRSRSRRKASAAARGKSC